MAMAAVGTAAPVYLIKPILNEIFVAKDREMLMILPAFLVISYLCMGLGKYVQMYQMAYIGEDIVRRIRVRLLGSLLELDLDFFNKLRGGELISRTTNDIARIRAAVSWHMAVIARESLSIVGLLGVAIYQSPRLAFYGLVVLPVAAYPLVWLANRMKSLSHRSQEKDSDITSRLVEIFNNMEIIKAHSSEAQELDSFRRDNVEFVRINMKGVRVREAASPLMEFIGSIAAALVMVFGGIQVIEGNLDMGTFFSFSAALFMVYTPIKRISVVYNQMFDAVAASERIFDMISRQARIKSGPDALEGKVDEVEFRDVTLSYDETQALDGISFKVARGETVALVGDSGGGKTSVVNLILRLYDPTSGQVLVNGRDAKCYDLKGLRDRVGIVTQRVFVFNDTIAANVAYGGEMDRERVNRALVEAGAWSFVSRLEHGIDTTLEEFGTNLSGGQRQRLAIARAIYKDPDILILDEATSALDNRSEAAIQDALEKVLPDKITLVIAHRLTTVDLADRIMVIQGGRIAGEGTKEELLQDCPEYRRLVLARAAENDPEVAPGLA